MGATRENFVKYPRTPHLFGSKGTDDDKHLGPEESKAFIADSSLVVEEKLDGTNVGIHFTGSGRMVLQCRGHEITWLSQNRPGLPVVALDAIRDILEVDATENQGSVIQIAREQCRANLRAGRNFAFNATNITRQMRQRWIELFAQYDARIEIIYLEPPLATILAQNRRRANPVPENVVLRLLEKLEPPKMAECHDLLYGSPRHAINIDTPDYPRPPQPK